MPMLQDAADKQYMLQLPKVSFREIKDDPGLLKPAGVHSEQCKSYGFNDFSTFQQPDFYIRYIEPIESELAVQVEYDMDDQDLEWLEAVNLERKKDQSGPVSYEIFEIIMDKLEKEWFDLVKRIPQPASHLPVEDSKCAICDDGEGENSNAIVFCDGCNLAVHQDCYGVPYIPEGQWLCRKCTVSPENPVSCVLCPNEGGAFKQATTGHWAHLLCAIWIPELTVGNAIYMEPIDGMESVPKSRWKLTCSFCRKKTGACIQCDNKACFTAFHVTCARQAGCLMSMKSMSTQGLLRAFCENHLPADVEEGVSSETESDFSLSLRDPEPEAPPTARSQPRARARRESHTQTAPVTTKSARAHAKSYRPGPPIVPQIIVKKLLDYIAKVVMRKKPIFVERLCRYWSLKREARRGAPLLKRLHLEPWTASSNSKEQSDAEKAKKLQFLMQLRRDLEKVRMLAETAKKREKEKLHQTQLIRDIVDGFIFPRYTKLRLVLENISAMDRDELFLHPVNRQEVPDYFEVIQQPMCWMWIDDKLEQNSYLYLQEFKRDISLVLDNAMLYNPSDHKYHRAAKRIKTNAQTSLLDLDSMSESLEPSLILLESLLSTTSTDLDRDYLSGIFHFAIEKPKPPTPTPSPPKSKPIRINVTAAEKKAKQAVREAAAKERPMTSRSTRAAKAMNKAFAEEAGLIPSSDSIEAESSAMGRRKSGRHTGVDTAVPAPNVTSRKDGVRKQIGVVAFEPLSKMSDKERRAKERELDLVTDDVDSTGQFARFNVGWVLPPGTKRNRGETSASGPDSKASLPAKPRKIKLVNGTVLPVSAALTHFSAGEDERGLSKTARLVRAHSTFSSDLSEMSLTPIPSSPPPESISPLLVPLRRPGKKRKVDELDVEVGSSPAGRAKRRRQKSGRSDTMDEEIVVATESSRTGKGRMAESAKLKFTKSASSRSRRGVEAPHQQVQDDELGGVAEGADLAMHMDQHTATVGTDPEGGARALGEEEEAEQVEEIEEKEDVAVASDASDDRLTPLPIPRSGRSSISDKPTRGRFAAKGKGKKRGNTGRGRTQRVAEAETEDLDVNVSAEGSQKSPDGEVEVAGEDDDAAEVEERDAEHEQEEEVEEVEVLEGEDGVEGVEVATGSEGELQTDLDEFAEEEEEEEEEEEIEELEEKEDSEVGEQHDVEEEDELDKGDDPYPPGTLVWAKILTFPYFPAEIVEEDEDDPEIPPDLFTNRAAHESRNRANGQRTWLVRFYDGGNSFGWIPEDRLDLLNEDDAIDKKYLKSRDRYGGRTGEKQRVALRKAYEDAIASMLSDEDRADDD